MNKKTLLALLVAYIVITPLFACAANEILRFSPPVISGIPGFESAPTGEMTVGISLQEYLVRIYQFAIGISGITAVGMIVWGGINLIFYSESIEKQSEGRNNIVSAVQGIALLFLSYFLLNAINPELVKLKEPGGKLEESEQKKAEIIENCGLLTEIPKMPSFQKTELEENGCEFKRLRIKESIQINENEYYKDSLSLPPGTMVWMYPYFLKDKGVSSKQCLIYAQKKPYDVANPPSVEMVPLQLKNGDKINLVKCPVSNPPQGDGASLKSTSASVRDLDLTRLDRNGSCKPSDGTSPFGVIDDTAANVDPYVCYSGCTGGTFARACDRRGVRLSENIINVIKSLQDWSKISGNPQFYVTSLTGGSHKSTSAHYRGKGMDVTFTPSGNQTLVQAWNKGLAFIRSLDWIDLDQSKCEYNIGGETKFIDNCDHAFDAGTSNQHIHLAVP